MITEAIIIGIVIGLVEVFKKINVVPERFIPIVAVVVGLAITFVSSIAGGDNSWIITGLVYGLMAAGVWDVAAKSVLGK